MGKKNHVICWSFEFLYYSGRRHTCICIYIIRVWFTTDNNALYNIEANTLLVFCYRSVPRIRCRGIHASNLFKSECCKLFYAVFMTCVRFRRQNNFLFVGVTFVSVLIIRRFDLHFSGSIRWQYMVVIKHTDLNLNVLLRFILSFLCLVVLFRIVAFILINKRLVFILYVF